MNKSFSIKGRHGPTFHRQRIFFIDRGNYEDGEKRKEKLSFVKKMYSVYGKSSLSVQCLVYGMPFL